TVTGDRQRGAEAVAWALAHRSETHQVAVILSWAGDLFTADQHKQLDPQCAAPGRKLLAYFGVAQPATGAYLLQLRPEEVEHPSWKQHLAALALVNLDPNSTASQFLQGWAMEDRFMLRDGPGVGYEFLWANPYLPGVSYQNMDPWSYTRGDLYARADWSDNACWLHIGTRGVEQQNCAQDIMSKALTIGSLMLVPVTDRCMDLHRENPRQTLILSKLRPEAALTYLLEGQKRHAEADQSGLWRVPVEIDGKVCVSK
ncbi:MAG: hypothetical protein JO061_01260, partial [Acidobacteriaceae bacterium]|nr:hypothetical protein [Acidobacteriaceae bacterium]